MGLLGCCSSLCALSHHGMFVIASLHLEGGDLGAKGYKGRGQGEASGGRGPTVLWALLATGEVASMKWHHWRVLKHTWRGCCTSLCKEGLLCQLVQVA